MDPGLALLKALTDIPSPSGDPVGIGRKGDVCRARLEPLGFDVETPILGGVPHLVARRPGGGPARGLLVSHLDVVLADPDRRFVLSEDRALGPGVADPLGGVVVMLRALELLQEAGDLDCARWTVVLNGDEEIGSPDSAPLLRALAQEHDAGFVFESGRATGVNPQDGANAVVALAHFVGEASALSAYDRGLSVNVGVVRGGHKRNQVPDRASAEIDVRYRDPLDDRAVTEGFLRATEAAQRRVPGAQVSAIRQRGRPAWDGGEATAALLEIWQAAAQTLGMPPITAVSTGGGSDANILADAGLACLDGLGAVGGGYHAPGEWILAESVAARARLTAEALRAWSRLEEA